MSKPEMRLKVIRRATVATQRDAARLHEVVPAVVFHLAVAGVGGAAAIGMGAPPARLFAAGLAACALGAPVAGLALLLAGWPKSGAALLICTYVGSAALGLYNLLGMGALLTALYSPPAPWKWVYFLTAALLPLLQIKGIWDAAHIYMEEH